MILKKKQLLSNPIEQFNSWYQLASEANEKNLDVMGLATSDKSAKPSLRMVLFKGIKHNGFIWYSNYLSIKAQHIDKNPFAALTFYWETTDQQVRIEGPVTLLSADESNTYFQTRAYDSQIGAWASEQSKIIPSRDYLEKRIKTMQENFGDDVRCPSFWGGFCLIPQMVEFWQGQAHRLHDRFRYQLDENNKQWIVERLAP